MSRPNVPAPIVDRRKPIAVSFLRYSRPEQHKGHSTKRQTGGAEAWCEHKGIPLDRVLKHEGSALRGKQRADTTALGKFLEDVWSGRVPRGSFLIIENLDRLSREDEMTALGLWMDILKLGIHIVTLQPEVIYRHDKIDLPDIIRAIISLSTAHGESVKKSFRSRENWKEAYQRAREGQPMRPRRKDGRVTKVITGRLPGWITEKDGVAALIPKRAEVVRRIFEMASAGYGMSVIARKLTAEQVPAFGRRVEDEESGGTKAAPGERYGSGEWKAAYIRQILTDRRVLGEHQPRDADGNKLGEAIAEYYPAAVTPTEFNRARARIADRTNPPGRIGDKVANLFGGLMRNARDQSTYYCAARSDAWGHQRVLLNRSAIEGKSQAFTFPYPVFEAAILSQLREVEPEAVTPPEADGGGRGTAERAGVGPEPQGGTGAGAGQGGNVSILAEAARAVAAREEELVAALEAAGAEQVAPAADTLAEAKTLAGMLADVPEEELEDVRLRLRSALRRVVDSVYVLVGSVGRVRVAAVEVYFRATGRSRNYFIRVKQPHGGPNGRTPGRWWCSSNRVTITKGGKVWAGLRDPKNVPMYLRELAEWIPEEGELNVTTAAIPYPEKAG
jgi:DNA invertase Pin-like site-specific DNA recombinase